jgi:hypothetical protein
MSHTPGPWRVGNAGFTVFGPKTERPAPVVVAEIPPPTPRVSREERKANARLIAAAPEVLAALETSLKWLEAAQADEPEDFDSPELRSAVDAARRAVALARGEVTP